MLPQTFEAQSNMLAHLVGTYATMVRTSNETIAAMAGLQSQLVAAQLRQAADLWQRYLYLSQEAQLAMLSSLQARVPEAGRSAQATTIEAAQHAIEAAAAPSRWSGEERRKSPIAVPVDMERRRAAA